MRGMNRNNAGVSTRTTHFNWFLVFGTTESKTACGIAFDSKGNDSTGNRLRFANTASASCEECQKAAAAARAARASK